MLWASLHTHSPQSTCDLSVEVVVVLSVLLRCTAGPLNSFGREKKKLFSLFGLEIYFFSFLL